jgi:hypothetical protein
MMAMSILQSGKRLMMGGLLALAALATVLVLPRTTEAQRTFTTDDAIGFVAGSPQFAEGLQFHEGWTAVAYDTGNAYGIWRVEFNDASGEDLGYADVSLERGRIYSWDAYFYPNDNFRQQAEPILRDFVYAQSEVLALVPNPADYDYWFDFDGWNNWWWFYINVGGQDSVTAVVRFEGGDSELNLSNPRLESIVFSDLPDYETWREAGRASATAAAFAQGEVAAHLRPHEGWTSVAEPMNGGSGGQWWVGFYVGDWLAAEAGVNVQTGAVEWWEVH